MLFLCRWVVFLPSQGLYMSTKMGFWQFHPRFYRKPPPKSLYRYLYWILGYEVLVMLAIGGYFWWTVVPGAKEQVERRNREVERMRRERLQLSDKTKAMEPMEAREFQ